MSHLVLRSKFGMLGLLQPTLTADGAISYVSPLEASAVFGASTPLLGEITVKKGGIEQSNFHNYPCARMTQASLRAPLPDRVA